jgi:hypothetical protein
MAGTGFLPSALSAMGGSIHTDVDQGERAPLRVPHTQELEIEGLRKELALSENEKEGLRSEVAIHKRSIQYAIRHQDEQDEMVSGRISEIVNIIGELVDTLRGITAREDRYEENPVKWAMELRKEVQAARENLEKLQVKELARYYRWLGDRPIRLEKILLAGLTEEQSGDESSDEEIPELKDLSDEDDHTGQDESSLCASFVFLNPDI